ncbi:hypothetical protein BY458DRAFT_576893 [Sporodiniella umbellata]|nr:hypothetical protein BY458DRAFT_576893 [Sporodiniella umbellata]
MTAAGAMMKMVTEHTDVAQILSCIYVLLVSLMLSIIEIVSVYPLEDPLAALATLRGKAFHTFLLAIGILDLLIGALYGLLSFLSACPQPRPAIENWQNWQEYSSEGMDLDRPMERKGMDNATRLKQSMIEKPLRNLESV